MYSADGKLIRYISKREADGMVNGKVAEVIDGKLYLIR